MTTIGDQARRAFVLCGVLWVVSSWPLPGRPGAAVGVDDGQAVADVARPQAERPEPGSQAAREDLRDPAAATYDLVALRVEFQPDTTRFTTGNGTFDGDPYGGLEPAVDPLPHDAAYFRAHLNFLEDYVARVSDGKTAVRSHLVPEVVRVPNRMGAYAPTGPDSGTDAERAKLAQLVRDAWTEADEQSSFDMSGFTPGRTALVLFHAGVGRDVELIGTTLEKTPEDLPSIFFGSEALHRLGAAGVTFDGFPVDHSMIVPRTETRLGTDFVADEPFLLELSINGLLAASFFNFLGVPDLFDVESGASAIGPFGLMDALGIFAYGGLFPPEPMAWTKYYLGWTDPVELDGAGPETVDLAAASLPNVSPSARVSVSEAEYFMVENRFRDPENDGLTLRVWQDGSITEQQVQNGDEEFNSQVIDGFIGGVVVGVDNYDWALPGGLDDDGNELNGGMLVWHVDERRLRTGLAANAVNVGDERAIDLEEADGAQDIGFPSPSQFGPQADLGTPFDFFYEGNRYVVEGAGGQEIRLYENRFGPATFPSSETNAGGPSFVVLDAFSEAGPDMSFSVRRTEVSGIAPLREPEIDALDGVLSGLSAGSKLAASGEFLVMYGGDSVAAARAGSAEPLGRWASEAAPAVLQGGRMATIERGEGGYRLIDRSLVEDPETADVYDLPAEVAGMTPASPIVYTNVERAEAFHVLFRNGVESVHVRADATGATVVPHSRGDPVGLAAREHRLLGIVPVAFGSEGVEIDGTVWTYDIEPEGRVGQPALAEEPEGMVGAVPLIDAGEVIVLTPGGGSTRIDVRGAAARTGSAEGELSAYPVIADLDDDRRLDVLVCFGRRIFAFTQAGAVAAGFPIELPAEPAGQPLVFQWEGDPDWTVLTAGTDGHLYAHGAGGRRADGFPLEAGGALAATPLLNEGTLVAVSSSGSVEGWILPPVHRIWWGSLFGSGTNDSYAGRLEPDDTPPSSVGLIDGGETYNWPNPIEDEGTHLRILTARDARVEVTIIDAGGGRIDELNMGTVVAGVPAEIVWQADVQSGLYFARFTATTADGERATKLIKMAVIR